MLLSALRGVRRHSRAFGSFPAVIHGSQSLATPSHGVLTPLSTALRLVWLSETALGKRSTRMRPIQAPQSIAKPRGAPIQRLSRLPMGE